MVIQFGRQVCGSLTESAAREWLVTDGLGGYAMGTVAGLRTRRYHGLLMVAGSAANGNGDAGVSKRMLGLAALDPVLVVGDTRIRLATDEWAGGTVDPSGASRARVVHPRPRHPSMAVGDRRHRVRARARDGARSRCRSRCGIGWWRLVVASGSSSHRCARGATATAIATRAPTRRSRRQPTVSCSSTRTELQGPDWSPGGSWYRGVRARAEAERGLADIEDLWAAGRFTVSLTPGESADVLAWAGDLAEPPPPAEEILAPAEGARQPARDDGARHRRSRRDARPRR